jgi:hypothetical protein
MKLLITSLIIFLTLLTTVFAKNNLTISSYTSLTFKDKVIFSPDVSFLWNFQRGVEEIYRIVKFSSTMRIDYSLDLCERRIGEMEVLIDKNKTSFIPITETDYEVELDKIKYEMNSTDIFSKIVKPSNIKGNVTERLEYNNKVLNFILSNSTEPSKDYIKNAVEKTLDCIDFINSVR